MSATYIQKLEAELAEKERELGRLRVRDHEFAEEIERLTRQRDVAENTRQHMLEFMREHGVEGDYSNWSYAKHQGRTQRWL
jgi:hypothetical protein